MYPDIVNQTWVMLRLGILPISAATMYVVTRNVTKEFHVNVTVLAIISYIAGIHSYFVSQTGFENSVLLHAFIQLVLGVATLPLRPFFFFAIVSYVLSLYALTIYFGSGVNIFLERGHPISLLVYMAMTVLLYYIIRISRYKSYNVQVKLEDEITNREITISELVAKQIDAQKAISRFEIASQVAHDIRSPLTALEFIVKNINVLNDDSKDLFKKTVKRIQEIANNLLEENKIKSVQVINATELIEDVVREKRVKHQNIQYMMPNSALSVMADSGEFKSIVSNIIDNSIDAISDLGTIKLKYVFQHPKQVTIRVIDNGRGIPADVLPQLLSRGATFNKANGTGLGLYNAKKSIVSWGGNIRIHSSLDTGTIVELDLILV